MSPVKEKRIPYMESSEKTKSKCVTKALQCIAAICETICPGEGHVLSGCQIHRMSTPEKDINACSTFFL
jgi:hypothetical protein